MKNQLLVGAVLTLISANLVEGNFWAQKAIAYGFNQHQTLQLSQTDNLVARGRKLYQNSQYQEAIAVWQQAVTEAKSKGDALQLALSWSYISLASQQLGQWQNATISLQEAQAILETKSEVPPALQAQILNTQGSLELALGKPEAAFKSWQQAGEAYLQAEDETGWLGSQVNQAQALQKLGFYRRAQLLLQNIQQKIAQHQDSQLKAIAWQNLGVALYTNGNFQPALEILSKSLDLSRQLSLNTQANILIGIGNTQQALQNPNQALLSYQEAVAASSNTQVKLEALLNQFSLLIKLERYAQAEKIFSPIQTLLTQLSPSRQQIYAQVNFAKNLIKYQEQNPQDNDFNLKIGQLLAQASKNAQLIADKRAQSSSLGTLGHLYLNNQQWQEAQSLTEKALQLAQAINAEDIAYQWQWQLGKIEQALGNREKAIIAYQQAVNTLNSLRADLVAISNEVQFSFREKVAPVYRELVALLLTTDRKGNIPQENLENARQTIEYLQLAELENFFRENCLDPQPKPIDQIDPHAAVIYTIILEDRLAVILSQPEQPLTYYATYLPQSEINNQVEEFLQSLNPAYSNQLRQQSAQTIYNWLISPAEKLINLNQIDTLVFVLDGFLQSIPMAALYDGEQYLIEKYRIALTPGLQLLASQSLANQEVATFMAGVSEANLGFSALPGVEVEFQEIASEIISQQLLNQQFTRQQLETSLNDNNYPILHFATHGQFSSTPDNTFILAWQDSINIQDFQTILRTRERRNRSPIELLILSACQTATGDRRATLGLAGMAVRSGARSTIATLWSVKDNSTARLMAELYAVLTQPEVKFHKAEALRQAQLKLLQSEDFNHPFYWAPFVLIGNWL